MGMDETRALTLEFNGRQVRATPLKPSQFTALQMMQHSLGTDERAKKANLRMYRILEKAVGPDEWELLMDDLADGVDNSAFATLVTDLVTASAKHLAAEAEAVKVAVDVANSDMAPLSEEEIAAFTKRMALRQGLTEKQA